MNPADQPQLTTAQRGAESPTLWLSLALGSVLIHLVLFILASIVSIRTAKVQLDVEPIAVEFFEPNAAVEQAASSQTTIARSNTPSSSIPSNPPAQPIASRSQPPATNQPAETPFIPLPPVKRKQLPVQPQPQPNPFSNPIPQPNPTGVPGQSQQNSQPQQPSPISPSQPQPTPGSNLPPGGLSGAGPNPTPQPTESQQPAESGNRITQLPQGGTVAVVVSSPRQTVDPQKQPARPIDLRKNLPIRYSSALASQTILLEASLYIDKNGSVVDVIKTELLSSESAIDPGTLNDIAKQIFSQWQFEPAQDGQDGKPLTPSPSQLLIIAQVQLP